MLWNIFRIESNFKKKLMENLKEKLYSHDIIANDD